MELVFDVVSAQQFVPGLLTSKTFKQAGGIIGRGEDCDWVIPDRKRIVSNRHAEVSYRDGAFYITDTSSNGTQLKESGANLPRGNPVRIEHGETFCMGDFEIRARLIRSPDVFESEMEIGRPTAAGSIIPDDAFLDLDPLTAIDQQERTYAAVDELTAVLQPPTSQAQQADYAQIDEEHLLIPELVPEKPAVKPAPPPQPEKLPETFWDQFARALDISLDGLDEPARQQLALNAAALLRHSIHGLQLSLRTRSELKNELRLSLTSVHGASHNPLKHSTDTREALTSLLHPQKAGPAAAKQYLNRGYRDLQAHQVAMLAASRAASKALLQHLAPEQLVMRFEREGNKPLMATSAGYWRAYKRLYQSLESNQDWNARLLDREFAQAYEDQVRLIATLDTSAQG